MKTTIAAIDSRLKLKSLLDDPNSTIQEISHVLSEDNELKVIVLKVVNSPFFGLQEKIDDASQAVALLGLGQLNEILFEELIVLPQVVPASRSSDVPVQNAIPVELCLA